MEQGDGAKRGGDAARTGHCSIHRVYQSLHHGVTRGVHVVRQGKATLSQAEEGIVTTGRNDPLVPAYIFEIYIQRMTPAFITRKAFQFRSTTTVSFHPSAVVPTDSSFIVPPPWYCIPLFLGPPPDLVSIAALAAAPGLFVFCPSNPLANGGGPPAMFD